MFISFQVKRFSYSRDAIRKIQNRKYENSILVYIYRVLRIKCLKPLLNFDDVKSRRQILFFDQLKKRQGAWHS